MTETSQSDDIATLQRPSGGFAMLAVDQREAMRNMFAEHTDIAVTDEVLRDFKVAATRILTPYASGVLVDRQFAFDAVVEAAAVSPECGLIASADQFESAHGELVGKVTIDRLVDPHQVKQQGAVAMKLLVLWREDEPAQGRIDMVEEFVELCRSAGLVSIIEPVARGRRDGETSDVESGVLAAAKELGALGADLYKAEVPFKGDTDDATLAGACRVITEAVDGPWVVLSSGVAQDSVPRAVEIAMQAGASGFLAGRAVWASCIGAEDLEGELSTAAVARLKGLGDLVDAQMGDKR